jgi:amidase|tara:strand:+ start:9301 stop:10731 length:1431 start_codon:yes stop_codon:yes gene_type:complete
VKNFEQYEDYDALGLAEILRKGEVTPTEVLEAAIDRSEKLNPGLNAIILDLHKMAHKTISKGLPEGILSGVPYLIKDLGATLAGTPTTGGSRFMKDVIPDQDSETVKRLIDAGFVIFGKSNTCEFGMSITCEPQLYGPTKNPWDESVTPGGSSGGAAAAVASRIVPAAHASDGFGSIRVPASCCGLVGLKPTRGRNSFSPFLGERIGGTVAEHAVSRTVRDQAVVLDITGSFPALGDPYYAPPPCRPFLEEVSADPGNLKIAYSYGGKTGAKTDIDHKTILDQTVTTLIDLGHQLEEVDPPISNEESQEIFRDLMAANAAQIIRSHPGGRLPEVGEVENVVAATAQMGEKILGHDIFLRQAQMHAMGRRMAQFHKEYDLLLTPGLGHLPPKLGWIDMMLDNATEYWDRVADFSPFTVWFNQTGQPAISLPIGQTESGFPVSVQLVSRFADEATLFRVSAQLEDVYAWHKRKPIIVK